MWLFVDVPALNFLTHFDTTLLDTSLTASQNEKRYYEINRVTEKQDRVYWTGRQAFSMSFASSSETCLALA